jgi:hypothetical protein
VDSFVHEVHALVRHLSASRKIDQSEAIFICTVERCHLVLDGVVEFVDDEPHFT